MTQNTNEALMARRIAAVPKGVGHATGLFAARAENAEIWDVEGRRFIDFAGGIAVLNVGHRHPRVMAAVQAQNDLYTHTAFQVVPYEPYIALCERLNALAPFSGPAKTLLVNSGAEAVENTIKIARAATGRSAVIAFTGGFHGRTLFTSALTGKVAPYKRGFGPMVPEVYHIPFPVPHHGVTVADSLKMLDFLFRADVEPARVAAFIIEPVQGEGGFYEAPVELMQRLRALCDEHGSLLIADEVQTGFARTGKMFGIENCGVEPDLISIAKSLGGGFPLAGVIGRADLMDAVQPGGLGSTYGGHPASCAAALAVLDVIADEGLIDRANVIGDRIKGRLENISRRNDSVPLAAIRGPGAMVGVDVVTEAGGTTPDAAAAARVAKAALERGLILLTCGVYSNAIRFLVPLTVQDGVLEEGLDILQAAAIAAHEG